MQKRGQITVYIVLGILVVAVIALALFARERVAISDWEMQRQAALTVPEKAREVQRFVQGCIEQTADAGVTLLGLQGGYITLPQETIPTPAHPFSTSLEIFPDAGLKTAYWFYVTPNNIQKSGMPTAEQMEEELAGYVENNIADCLQNFTLFEEYNVTAGMIEAESKIEDEEILFTVDMPVRVELLGFRYEIPAFYAKVNSRLGEFYAIGKELMEKGSEDFFLEERTIDILAVYDEIPFSGTELTCSPRLWTKSEVQEALKNALAANMQFVKVRGTDFEVREKYFVWEALEESNRDVSASFRYSTQWPLKLEIYPSDGEILKAEPLTKVEHPAMAYLMSLFCITDYNFIYDIAYPALVTLSDEEGSILQFATMVLVDNNQPRKNTLGTFEVVEPEKQICENAISPATIYVLAPDVAGALSPVEGAEVRLKCVSTVCDIGTTVRDRNNEAFVKANIPQCVNALLTAEKEGYLPASELVSTVEENTYSLMLEPLKEMDYEIKIIEGGYEREIEEGETVILNIDSEETGYSEVLAAPKGKISLAAVDLRLKSTLISEGFDIKIEGKEVTHCFKVPTKNILGLLGFEEEKCTTAETEDMVLNQIVRGGAQQFWSPSRAEIAAANKVTFYIPASELPNNLEELEAIYKGVESFENAINPMLE